MDQGSESAKSVPNSSGAGEGLLPEPRPGHKYGKLTVSGSERNAQGLTVWRCICDCGTSKTFFKNNLRTGNSTSCGCNRRVHVPGLSKTRLYRIWIAMHARCNDPKAPAYGAKGVEVCRAWASLERFYAWAMRNGYADDLTIDRINVNGNYSPRNCRWATTEVQANNTRRTLWVELDGERMSLKQATRREGVNYGRVLKFVTHDGISLTDAITAARAAEEARAAAVHAETNGPTAGQRMYAAYVKAESGLTFFEWKRQASRSRAAAKASGLLL